MQNFTEVNLDTLADVFQGNYINNDITNVSLNSGTAFPTTELFVGMLCYRTDEDRIFQLASIAPDVWNGFNDKLIHTRTSFPTLGLFIGMFCYRSDLDQNYQLKSIGPDVWGQIADPSPRYSASGLPTTNLYTGMLAWVEDEDQLYVKVSQPWEPLEWRPVGSGAGTVFDSGTTWDIPLALGQHFTVASDGTSKFLNFVGGTEGVSGYILVDKLDASSISASKGVVAETQYEYRGDLLKFGFKVAIDGNTIAASAPEAGATNQLDGRIVIYTRPDSNSAWSVEQEIQPTDISISDHFGYSLALEGDTLIASSPWRSGTNTENGGFYYFTRTGTVWTQQQFIPAPISSNTLRFGYSMALEGDTLLVGNSLNDIGGTNTGSVEYYTRSANVWTHQQTLTASPVGSRFGESMDLSGDTLVVGAKWDTNVESQDGSAYVFTRTANTWTQQQKFEPDAQAGVVDRFFGHSVAVQGDILAVSEIGRYGDTLTDAGAVYIYTRTGTVWTQIQVITVDVLWASYSFGKDLKLSGAKLLVGSNNPTSGAWMGNFAIYNLNPDGTYSLGQVVDPGFGGGWGYWGSSVDISGSTIVSGGYGQKAIQIYEPDPSLGAVVNISPADTAKLQSPGKYLVSYNFLDSTNAYCTVSGALI